MSSLVQGPCYCKQVSTGIEQRTSFDGGEWGRTNLHLLCIVSKDHHAIKGIEMYNYFWCYAWGADCSESLHDSSLMVQAGVWCRIWVKKDTGHSKRHSVKLQIRHEGCKVAFVGLGGSDPGCSLGWRPASIDRIGDLGARPIGARDTSTTTSTTTTFPMRWQSGEKGGRVSIAL